jgi:transposase-like protein
MSVLTPNVFRPVQAITEKVGHFSASRPNSRGQRNPQPVEYLNNRIERDHRGIKGQYGPMRGFKSHESASRFCRCFDELRNHLQARSRRSRNLPTNARRHRFLTRGIVALRILEAA